MKTCACIMALALSCSAIACGAPAADEAPLLSLGETRQQLEVPDEWASLVTIRSYDSRGDYYRARGVLVRPDWVLVAPMRLGLSTSAHVRLGDVYWPDDEGNAEAVGIEEYYNWGPQSQPQVLLVKLSEPLPGGKPVRLISPGRMSEVQAGDLVVLDENLEVPYIGTGADCEGLVWPVLEDTEACYDYDYRGGFRRFGDPAFVERDSEWFLLSLHAGAASSHAGDEIPSYPIHYLASDMLEWINELAPGNRTSWLPSSQIVSLLF